MIEGLIQALMNMQVPPENLIATLTAALESLEDRLPEEIFEILAS